MIDHDSTEMPFLDHLEELRWRIIWSLLAVVISVGVAFAVLMQFDVIKFLERPILPYLHGRKLVYTHPGDPFSIVLNASIVLGVVIALPVIIYQLWAFISPALYRKEKRVVVPLFFFATFLFLSGVSLAFFVVLPLAVEWLMSFQTAALEPMITASEYFNFATSMALAFGLCFELPIVILALAALGIVTPQFLNRYRRHALVVCVIIGAFLTPGDLIWTTVAMAVPLYFLYEISVVLTIFVHRRRMRREAQREAEAAAAGHEATA
ncbi:MAG: twin-arginine translocase subunit TatC [Gemmatimonadaceae bacterium]|nr:twin-arginine translocase subunit TatC [Gemmatimonadaceae bacterium]